jgi:outer membrane receptor for ferrienterochelin and colicins
VRPVASRIGVAALGLCLDLLPSRTAHGQSPSPGHGVPADDSWEITDLSLEELLESDRPVTIATKVTSRASEAPSIVTVIPRSVLEAYGYRTVGEALAGVPGLYVVDDHVTANVGIRGVNGGPDSWSRIVKIMVDGRPVPYHSTGGYLLGFEFIPMQAVEAIEVIRGPASGLYGANAFLGVINVVTRRAVPGASFELHAEAGLRGEQPGYGGGLLATFNQPGPRPASFLAALSGEWADRSGLAPPAASPRSDLTGQRSVGDRSRPRSAFVKGSWGLGRAGELELRYLHQRLDAHAQWLDMSVLAPDNRLVVKNQSVRADHRVGLPRGLTWRSVASLDNAGAEPEQVLDTGEPTFTLRRARDNRAFDVASELLWQLGRHSLLLGADFSDVRGQGDTLWQVRRQDQGTARAGDAAVLVRGERHHYQNQGLFLQSIVYPVPALGLTANLRVDRDARWGTELSYRAAGVYQVREGLHVKLLYGTSYVPPSLSQLHAAPLRVDNGITGNPGLRPQTARTGEAALTWRHRDLFSVGVNAFVTEIADRIEFVKVGSQNVARNFTPTRTVGGELSVDSRQGRLFGKFDVSVQKTSVEAPDPVPSWFTVAHGPGAAMASTLPNYPEAMGHLHAGASIPEARLQAAASLFVAGRRKATVSNILEKGTSYTFAPYATIGLHLRTQELRLIGDRTSVLELHLTNALDTPFAHGGTLGVDVPALGRSLFLRLTQRL